MCVWGGGHLVDISMLAIRTRIHCLVIFTLERRGWSDMLCIRTGTANTAAPLVVQFDSLDTCGRSTVLLSSSKWCSEHKDTLAEAH
jgi:hypothetical protein